MQLTFPKKFTIFQIYMTYFLHESKNFLHEIGVIAYNFGSFSIYMNQFNFLKKIRYIIILTWNIYYMRLKIFVIKLIFFQNSNSILQEEIDIFPH